MSIFNLHANVLEDYSDYVRSFFTIADARAREFIESELAELDAWFARAYGLTRKQRRYILDPADLTPRELENIPDPWEEVRDPLDTAGYAARLAASNFTGETFRVLKEKETAKFGEYRTCRLVLEAWDKQERETRRRSAWHVLEILSAPGFSPVSAWSGNWKPFQRFFRRRASR